ncbi:hypothetical protein JVX90_10530 [Gordonia sp. PDNC005]|uniref:hypothetical protein n=1 Tax=unclassified Gordonia (in: high G+C Gram-positive bacteria) TaxID=2657482 RepID=UPI001963431D|nr:hypothetical protein [Gordonia sp. PDNC005]QRY60899.1 hypothetical protein JVX90_10530 [Gordonia sp. PDNC005]
MPNRIRNTLIVAGIAACSAVTIGVGTAAAYDTIYVDEALYPHTDTLTSGVFDVSVTNKTELIADCTVTLYPTSEKADAENLATVTNDWWRKVASDTELSDARASVTGEAGTATLSDIPADGIKTASITPSAPLQSSYVVFKFCRADDLPNETYKVSATTYEITATTPEPENPTFGSLTGPGLGSLGSLLP